jgi:hypothetical protein
MTGYELTARSLLRKPPRVEESLPSLISTVGSGTSVTHVQRMRPAFMDPVFELLYAEIVESNGPACGV